MPEAVLSSRRVEQIQKMSLEKKSFVFATIPHWDPVTANFDCLSEIGTTRRMLVADMPELN
jgi:hypothetical protein